MSAHLFFPDLVQGFAVYAERGRGPRFQTADADLNPAGFTVTVFVAVDQCENIFDLLRSSPDFLHRKVFRPQPKAPAPAVRKDADTFVVVAPELERIVARISDADAGVRGQLGQQLQRMGITRALVKAGIKPGDRVRCGKLEWEWE